MESIPQSIRSMVAALHAEAESVRRAPKDGSLNAELVDGHEIGRAGPEVSYQFKRLSWPSQLQADRTLVVQPKGSSVWHPVLGCEVTGEDVIVRCSTSLGNGGVQAILREDDARSCLLLAAALERLAAGGQADAFARAGFILGGGQPRLTIDPRPERVVTGFERLNAPQKNAVGRALGNEVTFVWGPPGTGKTDVVARIVQGFVRTGMTVLLVAPTNLAVDQALERTCDLLSSEPGFAAGLVQRVGALQLDSLRDRYGSAVDPPQILARLLNGLGPRVQALREERSRIQEMALRRQEADTLGAQALEAQDARDHYVSLLNVPRFELEHTERQIHALAAAIESGRRKRSILRGRADRRLAQWQAERAELSRAAEQRQQALEALEAAARRKTEEHRAIWQRAAEAGQRAGTLSVGEIQQRAQQIQRELEILGRKQREIEGQVARGARVVAMTTHRSYQGRIPLDSIDAVVIDEAGMVDLPSSFHLASLATKRLVVAGDFRQLPAIVHGSTDALATEEHRSLVRAWVDRDPFRASGVVGGEGVGGEGVRRDDPRLAALRIQYRMRPAICELVSSVAYPDARLETGRDDGSRLACSPLLPSALSLVDTSGLLQTGGTGRSNRIHAALICELARRLKADGVVPDEAGSSSTGTSGQLAVISPYRDQVRLLATSFKEEFGPGHGLDVDTVHRFQGSQRPLIIMDTVTGAHPKLAPFFAGTGLDSQTCRLLNVALSRAQDHLVVVANVDHLRRQLGPASEVRIMLDHMEAHAYRVPIENLIASRSAADLPAMAAGELDKPAFFAAVEAYQAIEWDLNRAQVRVEIYCAYMWERRVKQLRGLLSSRLAHGVKVMVFTRPPSEEARNGPLIEMLRSDGCFVVERPKMHEKVVIVDDVLWQGSMNLFAQRQSTELMMRIRSIAMCNEVRRLVKGARPAAIPH